MKWFSRGRSRAIARLAAAGLAASALEGCAALKGGPDDIAPTATLADTCPTDAQVTAFDAVTAPPNGLASKKLWRNEIVGGCIEHVNGKYKDFLVKLRELSVGTDLGTDLIALGLTGAGAVASKSAANALSAATTGLVGAGAAFNKEIFYQKTLPAVEEQMAANRASVYKDIVTSEQGDETAYTLVAAQYDIRRYAEAGTIDAAISVITSTAQQSKAADTAATSVLFTASIQPPALVAQKDALAAYIHGLDITTSHNATLDTLYTKIVGPVPAGQTQSTERMVLLVHIANPATTAANMSAICTEIEPTTGKNFCQ